jgi:hypothetical protein
VYVFVCVCMLRKTKEQPVRMYKYTFDRFSYLPRPIVSASQSDQYGMHTHLLRNPHIHETPHCAKANNQVVNLHFCRTCHNCLKSSFFSIETVAGSMLWLASRVFSPDNLRSLFQGKTNSSWLCVGNGNCARENLHVKHIWSLFKIQLFNFDILN